MPTMKAACRLMVRAHSTALFAFTIASFSPGARRDRVGVEMLSIDAWLDEKPYKELYDRVVHAKVSPKRTHALIVAELSGALREWARGRGEAGVEWRVYLGEGTTVVPDVAFFFDKRLASLTAAQRETPPFAPDIAIEVRSPDDRESNIKRKTQLYLAHGA